MENIITKSCNQFGTIRQINEVPALWCGSDVAKALGYARPHDAISAHCRCTVKRRIPHPQSKNRTIEMSFIPEADVYRLICHSKLPKAQEFEKWVFEDVVPEAVHGSNQPTYDSYTYSDKTYNGEIVLTTEDIAHLLKLNRATVSDIVRKNLTINKDYYFLQNEKLMWFKSLNPQISRTIRWIMIVTRKGFNKLCEIYGVEVEKPECLTIKPKSDNDTDMLKRICKDNNLAIVPLDDEVRDMMKDMFKDDTKDVEYLWEINDKKYILYDENATGIRKQYLIAVGIAQFMNLGGTPTITPEKIFASVFTALSLFNQYKEK